MRACVGLTILRLERIDLIQGTAGKEILDRLSNER
jgi:hypothetical protein